MRETGVAYRSGAAYRRQHGYFDSRPRPERNLNRNRVR